MGRIAEASSGQLIGLTQRSKQTTAVVEHPGEGSGARSDHTNLCPAGGGRHGGFPSSPPRAPGTSFAGPVTLATASSTSDSHV